MDRVEVMHMRADGVLELQFTSIEAGGKAFGILNSYGLYHGCQVEFVRDPCELPLETLLKSEETVVKARGIETGVSSPIIEISPESETAVCEKDESLSPKDEAIKNTKLALDTTNKISKEFNLKDQHHRSFSEIDDHNARVLANMVKDIKTQSTNLLDVSVY